MAREDEYEYDSSSAPSTPRHSGGFDEEKKKKKRGLKKLISFTKNLNPNHADKPPGSPQREIGKDEGGESQSRRRSLTGFFKRSSTSKSDDAKPQDDNGATQSLLEKIETHERHEVPKEKSEVNKHIPNLAEKIGGELKQLLGAKEVSQTEVHKPTQATNIDDEGKSKEHQESKVTTIVGHVKEFIGHDQHHHHKHVEDEQNVTTESEEVQVKSRRPDSPRPPPPSPPPPLEEKECFGCESIAKGLQHICLPWTIKKEEH